MAGPPKFPIRSMALFAMSGVVTLFASSAASTPVYHLYQELMGLSPLMVTLIFSAYVFALLTCLLVVGGLSDHIGRRPMIFAALGLNAAAMLVFIFARDATALIVARVLCGLAVGAATTTLGAAAIDADPQRAPLLNSIGPFIGLTVGALGAGALVALAPAPTQLVYLILLAATVAQAALLVFMPETTAGRPGAWRSLRPTVSVPHAALAPLLRLTPINVASWGLGGFYFSLMPSLVRVATGQGSPLVGGAVVACLSFAGVVSVVLSRRWPAALVLRRAGLALIGGIAVTLGGVLAQQAAWMVVGALIAGLGFGSAFAGVLKSLLPLAGPGERAGLLSAFYVESYLGFALPAIGVGLVAPHLGLVKTACGLGLVLIVLTTASLIALRAAERRA